MSRPANQGTRGGGRPGSGNSAGARGAILLVVAAVLGIVLLQAFDTDVDGGSNVPVETDGSTVPGGGTATSLPSGPTATSPTTPARAPADVTVLVANGTGVKGLGSKNADSLKALGYTTPTAVDATRALENTTVQYAEGYEAEARAIALTLGLSAAAVQPLNSPAVPDTAGVNVFVLLGADVTPAAATTTTVA